MFTIRAASLTDIIAAHELIPEFAGSAVDFEGRLDGKEALAVMAWDGDSIAGYGVSYMTDTHTAYIWMVGTVPIYRRRGVYQQVFAAMEAWAKERGALKLQLKTRNARRDMLAWLVKHDFLFVAIDTQDDILDNRIMTEKALG